MSWAYGHDENGREIGYSVLAKCDQAGCDADIDRGLDYRCGVIHEDNGCGLHFCHKHLSISLFYSGSLCSKCSELELEQAVSDPDWVEP